MLEKKARVGNVPWIPDSPSSKIHPLQASRYDALRRVARTIAAHRDPQELFNILAEELHPIVDFSLLRVFLYEETRHVLQALVREPVALAAPAEIPPDDYPAWWVYKHQEPLVLSSAMIEERFPRMTETRPGISHSVPLHPALDDRASPIGSPGHRQRAARYVFRGSRALFIAGGGPDRPGD